MFEKIKENWNKRIQRNAFKSTLEYINRKGVKLINKGTREEDIPSRYKISEQVYFKRSLLPLGDWGRIYPPIKENGRISLTNLIFGGRRNLIKLILILGIIALVFMQFYDNFILIESLKDTTSLCNISLTGLN